MNHITITGTITSDVQAKTVMTRAGESSLASVLVASIGAHRVTVGVSAWGDLGKYVCDNFRKGDFIGLSGYLQINSVKQPDGSYRNYAEVIAEVVDPPRQVDPPVAPN